MRLAHRLGNALREEWLLATLLAALPLLVAASPGALPVVLWHAIALIHWETLAALAGLMVLSRVLEDSGYLYAAGRWLLARLHGERTLALVLVLFAAALSMVVTNDVALFIVVPLTLGLRSAARLPIGRLVIFEALAVNAGSALSPVGNPQNLYLWQTAGVGFFEFARAMAPLALGLLALLVAAIPLGFAGGRITVEERLPQPTCRRHLLWIALPLYPALLVCTEFGWPLAAAAAIVTVFLVVAPAVLRNVDWALLAVFALMFVDLGLLAELHTLQRLGHEPGAFAGDALAAGIVLSQIVSNVPAAIFLAQFTDDWIALAWGVSVGGFGLAIGSLANLIALRLAREPGLWRAFHGWSLPFLAAGWIIAWLLLPGATAELP
jgi:Na+/H+ antiporter NhaD/arsenite permease-like protein